MTAQQRWLAIAAFGAVALILALKAPAPDELAMPINKRSQNNMGALSTNKNPAVLADKSTLYTFKLDTFKLDTLKLDTLKLDTLQPRSMAQLNQEDIFNSKSWAIAPPPAPKSRYVSPRQALPPPPPPAPTAPPLPYQLMGSFQEPGKKLVIYLSRGDKLYSVSVGDIIDSTYQVESINAGQLELLYLPLKMRQILRLGDG